MPLNIKAGLTAAATWLAKDLFSRVIKGLVGLAILFASPFALGVVAQLANAPVPSDWAEAWVLIQNALPALLTAINNHPVHASSYAFLIAVTAVFVFMLIRAHGRIREKEDLLSNAATYKELVEQIGLLGRYPHAQITSGDGASWKELCEDIERTNNTFAFILGANGADTFGAATSPLYESIGKLRGRLQVVLLHPKSSAMKARAQAVGTHPSEYVKSINLSKKRLRDLARSGRSIEARFYRGQPNWKMIITNERVWIQYYWAGGPDIVKTPVFVFFNSGHQYSFYNIFYAEFCRIWERCNDDPMPLR